MTPKDFRAELTKIMPGYAWTVHKNPKCFDKLDLSYLEATGTQSSGFNRLSTLYVIRREKGGVVSFEAKSSGYGLRAKWLHTHTDGTLARALRGLQDHYEMVSNTYRGHAESLRIGRISAAPEPSFQRPIKEVAE